jgi:hypothetical protein
MFIGRLIRNKIFGSKGFGFGGDNFLIDVNNIGDISNFFEGCFNFFSNLCDNFGFFVFGFFNDFFSLKCHSFSLDFLELAKLFKIRNKTFQELLSFLILNLFMNFDSEFLERDSFFIIHDSDNISMIFENFEIFYDKFNDVSKSILYFDFTFIRFIHFPFLFK